MTDRAPRSPCDYSDDDAEAQRTCSPGSPESMQMQFARTQILASFRKLQADGELATETHESPVGTWFVKCKPRKTYSNRGHDTVVTRPRGVGGRYRTVAQLEIALDEAVRNVT